MSPKSRSAHATVFGFDFQVNAAIILMVENMTELKSLRLEGDSEDIEIELENGHYILAQAKSIQKSSSDFSHVRENLKKALTSLSDGAKRVPVDKLILITNSPNPLNEDESKSIFYGHAHRSFASLPESSKDIVRSFLHQMEHPLVESQFMIQVVPFETDDEKERYKVVWEVIDGFIGRMNLNISGMKTKLWSIWHNSIFGNGSKMDTSIKLHKKDIIWPIIVIATDIERCDDLLADNFDNALYDEITHRYRGIIDSCCERCDFFIKVLYDYNNYQATSKKPTEKCIEFAMNRWDDYIEELKIDGIDEETQCGLIQIILYSIVRNRLAIDRIKKEVKL